MTNTTHYNMTIAEGTDVVNPLTQIFPNFNTIDSAMFSNKQAGIGTASEVTTGTVHAIVRANPDSNVFRFTATSAWTSGDTMTLDGNSVVVHMSDGTTPANGAYIIGAEVLAMVNSGLVTLAISSNGGVTSFNTRKGDVVPTASDYSADMIDFDNTNTQLTSTDIQGAVEELANRITVKTYTIQAASLSPLGYLGGTGYLGVLQTETATYGKIISASAIDSSQFPCIVCIKADNSLNILGAASRDITARVVYSMP